MEGPATGDADLGVQQTRSNLGGMIWECVAVTLNDVQSLVNSFRKTRDGNEKTLREQLDVHLLPILEKQEESRKRRELQRQRELLSLAKMATAKRSSRIAGKVEQQKEEEKAKEEQERAQKELQTQRREEQKRLKLERERDFRMFSREKRLKERAARRHIHEEELAQLSEGRKSTPEGPTRISDRQLQSEIDRNKQALRELEEEEEEWTFDCICGLYGQVDDGAHSIACERCGIWQHSNCVGIAEAEADRSDFHFICGSCQRRIEEANTPRKTIIKLKVKGSSDSTRQPPKGSDAHTLSESKDIVDPATTETTESPSHSAGQDSTIQIPKATVTNSGTADQILPQTRPVKMIIVETVSDGHANPLLTKSVGPTQPGKPGDSLLVSNSADDTRWLNSSAPSRYGYADAPTESAVTVSDSIARSTVKELTRPPRHPSQHPNLQLPI